MIITDSSTWSFHYAMVSLTGVIDTQVLSFGVVLSLGAQVGSHRTVLIGT